MEDDPTLVRSPTHEIVIEAEWPDHDEPTVPFDLEADSLRPAERVVIGYLTMEQHGLFAPLSDKEQAAAVANLRRS